MWTIFDSIGSGIIGASIMFMVFALILQMNSISGEIEENNLIQSHYTATMEILNYDLHKIGFKVNEDKILSAGSENIKYCTDIGNDGSVDTVAYSTSTNPEDSIGNTLYIYRCINSGPERNIGVVSDFNISYFDSLGNKINYASLVSATQRARIRSLQIQLELTVERNDTTGFKDINWHVRIKPKNLLFRN